jgi:hypothetical protein
VPRCDAASDVARLATHHNPAAFACLGSQVSLLKLREKELDFYTKNCSAIGTQAALLSGFAYSSFIGMDLSEVNTPLQILYTGVTAAAMTVEIIALVRARAAPRDCAHARAPLTLAPAWPARSQFNSTMCAMLGPGLALRGPEGSMHKAVDGLTVEYRVCFLFFVLGPSRTRARRGPG